MKQSPVEIFEFVLVVTVIIISIFTIVDWKRIIFFVKRKYFNDGQKEKLIESYLSFEFGDILKISQHEEKRTVKCPIVYYYLGCLSANEEVVKRMEYMCDMNEIEIRFYLKKYLFHRFNIHKDVRFRLSHESFITSLD